MDEALEAAFGCEVEVVVWLVEQEHVGRVERESNQRRQLGLPAR